MHYHIILTERCNSKCRYCYEKSMKEFENGLEEKWEFDSSIPVDCEVKVENLKNFLKASDTLIFYGGEPLLKLDKIKEIIDNISCQFVIQTNGKLLDTVPDNYLMKFSKMLVSIDGDKERTDFNKGTGTYDKVVGNVKNIRERGFKGEIVARMTISYPDLFEQVKYLLDLGIFDAVHWQIDAGFYKNDFDFEEFSIFVEKYNESVKELIDFWISKMKEGKVLMLYPFVGIVESILKDEKTRLRCGSGYSNYTINTNGMISACPILNGVKNFYCGKIGDENLKEINVLEPCSSCDYLDLCGGRCLYSNYAKLWPREGQELICKTIIYLIDFLRDNIPKIKKLIDEGIIKLEDFNYEKYFGPEIIP
jgi:uncharacterized protein